MPPLPWLTDAEVAELCQPLVQPAAQVRYLRGLGLAVERRPNGRPLVLRSQVEAVLGGQPVQAPAPQPAGVATAPRGPNREGFVLAFQRRAAA